jgi:hypothetical protein
LTDWIAEMRVGFGWVGLGRWLACEPDRGWLVEFAVSPWFLATCLVAVAACGQMPPRHKLGLLCLNAALDSLYNGV